MTDSIRIKVMLMVETPNRSDMRIKLSMNTSLGRVYKTVASRYGILIGKFYLTYDGQMVRDPDSTPSSLEMTDGDKLWLYEV